MDLRRIYHRLMRRRRVGCSYDMAKEIVTWLPDGARTLDVGCGSGFIAHHLGAMLGVRVQGTDVGPEPEATIPYSRFNGVSLPLVTGTFDAVLFCYVLHHAADASRLLADAARVLTPSGRLVIYEDTPRTWLDRLLCLRHERQWKQRTGRCTFRRDSAWRQLFATLGLQVSHARSLSPLRDPMYPVHRSLYVLEKRA
jgi:ubiquinone/menaquinone biosynthesis C-methylase UbiE